MTREDFIGRIVGFVGAVAPTRLPEARTMASELWAELSAVTIDLTDPLHRRSPVVEHDALIGAVD